MCNAHPNAPTVWRACGKRLPMNEFCYNSQTELCMSVVRILIQKYVAAARPGGQRMSVA
jgi:hypothetical protein